MENIADKRKTLYCTNSDNTFKVLIDFKVHEDYVGFSSAKEAIDKVFKDFPTGKLYLYHSQRYNQYDHYRLVEGEYIFVSDMQSEYWAEYNHHLETNPNELFIPQDFSQKTESIKMTKTYVLYHKGCIDGSGAMFAAYKKFGDKATYIPVQYGDKLPEIENGSEVYILDFCYSREVIEALNARISKLVVLDHHQTSQKAMEGLGYCVFDLNRSGAMLAWNYFHPELKAPEVIELVQDRDLWRFKLEDSRSFSAGFQNYRDDLNAWDMACSDTEEGQYFLKKIKEQGKPLLDYEKSLINQSVKNAKIIHYGGHRVGIVNTTTLISEIGAAICREYAVDYALMFVVDSDSKVILSFRSEDDFDCSVIAQKHGGGGHKCASGAAVDLSVLTSILSSKVIKA